MYATDILTWFSVFLGVVFILQYNWKRRFIYYYSSKMPGPIARPIVGSVQVFFGKQHDHFNVFMRMLQTYPPVFRAWFGKHLYIFTSRPEDAEVILNSFLAKASFYEYFIMPSNTVSAPAADDDAIRRKRFIYLVLDEGGKLTRGDTLDEMALMLTAASKTTAITITSAMIAMALYPDVQEKIYQELTSILGDDIRDPTVEDMRKMEYLDRVVKETIRLFPAVPFISRSVDQDVPLDSYVFPAGSNVVIPIIHIHRRAELWPDPLKFDPDRFLPEEVKKRHPCAFIPFSIGARNCIGFKYGMESMKVILATIVKSVKIKSLNYNSLEDIQLKLHFITEPKGYNVTFERRI